MNCAGLICEYNPFHNGHEYHLQQSRRLSGCEHMIAVMSGSFVQRGEPAMFDKHLRARWALEHGADMVLELPAVFTLGCAERFAKGGVQLLAGTGLVGSLCFGSESGNASALGNLAALLNAEDPALRQALLQELKTGAPYPAALATAIEQRMPGASALLGPNDMLALEYMRALPKGISPVAILRAGAQHDSQQAHQGFASAASLRALLAHGKGCKGLVPSSIERELETIVSAEGMRRLGKLASPLLYALRCTTLQQLKDLPDISEGLENRLFEARCCATLEEALASIKTKRYTLARIKRALMCLLLGITSQDAQQAPYIRVLGVRKDSAHLLSALAEKASLPVVVRHADAAALPPGAARLLELDMLAAELAALAAARPAPARFDFAAPLIMV